MDPERNGQNDVATKRPFDTSGFTPVHNTVFDVIMPTLNPNAFKVLCVAIRQTLGWRDPSSDDPRDRKQWDHIAYSQFREKAGIASDATVKRAIDECLERGYLLQKQPLAHDGTPRTVKGRPYYEYGLNRDYELPIEGPGAEEEAEPTTTETVDLGEDDSKSTETVDLKSTETVDLTDSKSTETVDLTRAKSTETVDTKQSLKQKPKEKKKQQQQTRPVGVVDSLSEKQEEAYAALRAIGFQPNSDAKRYARDHKPEVVLSWVSWAIRQDGLENPAALVRKRLDAGEPAPSGKKSQYDDIDFGDREERRRYLEWASGDKTMRVNVDHNNPSKRERTFKHADDPDNPGQQIAYEVTLREGENLDDYEIIKGPDGPKLARKVRRSKGPKTTAEKWAEIDEWAAQGGDNDSPGKPTT